MKVYLYDENGFFLGEDYAQIDPLESKKLNEDVYILPAMSTQKKPPQKKEGYAIKWNGEEWEYISEKTDKEELSDEEKKQEKRIYRNHLICSIFWRVERYQTQREAALETTESKETYNDILLYIQYLRDYPDNTKVEWWEQNPLDFDEWRKK